MNKEETVNIEGALEAAALRVLREVPGLAVARKSISRERTSDALLRFAGKKTPITVEFKRHANSATAWQLVHRSKVRPHQLLLLVAEETTAEARKILRDHGVAVIDGLGNAHIQLPGLLFHLEGRKRSRARTLPVRLQGKAGTVAQALLLDPQRAWQVTELAEHAQVSPALAHRVLSRLENQGLMVAEGAGPKRLRRVVDRTALLDLWVEEEKNEGTRTFAHRLAQTPRQLIAGIADDLNRSQTAYALTGAAAAMLIAPFVTSVSVIEAWVEDNVDVVHVLEAMGAAPVTEGHNVVLQQGKHDGALAFRERVDSIWIVNRLRLYVDLRRDPRRGHEQADHLRREVIGF